MKDLIIRARVSPGRDDDLIEWLFAQSDGQRSEAIRALMRDGLWMQELLQYLPVLVRQSVTEAVNDIIQGSKEDAQQGKADNIELRFGDKLDNMLEKFG